jgi:hypothetical protein
MICDVIHLNYQNPLAPPRTAAVKYWDTEIGNATNVVPSGDEIGAALADPNPRIRAVACRYLELTPLSFDRRDLLKTNSSAELRKSLWAMLEVKSITFPPGSSFPMLSNRKVPWVMSAFTNNLAQVDPGLALLTSMELALEKKDTSIMDCVTGHEFTKAEIAVIKPDVYRIARASKLVRDKLLEMKFAAPELSAQSLHELENTNLFTLVQTYKN